MNAMQNIADRYGVVAHCAISYILDKGYEQIVKITRSYEMRVGS